MERRAGTGAGTICGAVGELKRVALFDFGSSRLFFGHLQMLRELGASRCNQRSKKLLAASA